MGEWCVLECGCCIDLFEILCWYCVDVGVVLYDDGGWVGIVGNVVVGLFGVFVGSVWRNLWCVFVWFGLVVNVIWCCVIWGFVGCMVWGDGVVYCCVGDFCEG